MSYAHPGQPSGYPPPPPLNDYRSYPSDYAPAHDPHPQFYNAHEETFFSDPSGIAEASPELELPELMNDADPRSVFRWCRQVIEMRPITPPRHWRRIRFDLPQTIHDLHLDPPKPEVVPAAQKPSSSFILLLETSKEDGVPLNDFIRDMLGYMLECLVGLNGTTPITSVKIVKKGLDKVLQLVITLGTNVNEAERVVNELKNNGIPVAFAGPSTHAEAPNATFQIFDFHDRIQSAASHQEKKNMPKSEEGEGGEAAPASKISFDDILYLFAPTKPTKTVDAHLIPSLEQGIFYAPVKRPETVYSFLRNPTCSLRIQHTLFQRLGVLVTTALCPHIFLLKGVPYSVQREQLTPRPTSFPAPHSRSRSHSTESVLREAEELRLLEDDDARNSSEDDWAEGDDSALLALAKEDIQPRPASGRHGMASRRGESGLVAISGETIDLFEELEGKNTGEAGEEEPGSELDRLAAPSHAVSSSSPAPALPPSPPLLPPTQNQYRVPLYPPPAGAPFEGLRTGLGSYPPTASAAASRAALKQFLGEDDEEDEKREGGSGALAAPAKAAFLLPSRGPPPASGYPAPPPPPPFFSGTPPLPPHNPPHSSYPPVSSYPQPLSNGFVPPYAMRPPPVPLQQPSYNPHYFPPPPPPPPPQYITTKPPLLLPAPPIGPALSVLEAETLVSTLEGLFHTAFPSASFSDSSLLSTMFVSRRVSHPNWWANAAAEPSGGVGGQSGLPWDEAQQAAWAALQLQFESASTCGALRSLLQLKTKEEGGKEHREGDQRRLREARRRVVRLLLLAPRPAPDEVGPHDATENDWTVISGESPLNELKVFPVMLANFLALRRRRGHQSYAVLLEDWVESFQPSSDAPTCLSLAPDEREAEAEAFSFLLARCLPRFLLDAATTTPSVSKRDEDYAEWLVRLTRGALYAFPSSLDSSSSHHHQSKRRNPLIHHLLPYWPTIVELISRAAEAQPPSRTAASLFYTAHRVLHRWLGALVSKEGEACSAALAEAHTDGLMAYPLSWFHQEAPSPSSGLPAEIHRPPPLEATRWFPPYTSSLPLCVLFVYLQHDLVDGLMIGLWLLQHHPHGPPQQPPPPPSPPSPEALRALFRFFTTISHKECTPFSLQSARCCGVFIRALEVMNQESPLFPESEIVQLFVAMVEALPSSPQSLPIYLALRQIYFDLEVAQSLRNIWDAASVGGEQDDGTAADGEKKPEKRENVLTSDGHFAHLQRILNARKTPSRSDLEPLLAQAARRPSTNASAAAGAASSSGGGSSGGGGGAYGIPSWNSSWTERLASYPKVGAPFPPLSQDYTVALSRSYGFYYFKPHSSGGSRVHLSPTYEHPETGKEYMASPQAFFREPSVNTALSELVQYANQRWTSGEGSPAPVTMREANVWFHDQRVRHILLDAAVRVRFKITYKCREESSEKSEGSHRSGTTTAHASSASSTVISPEELQQLLATASSATAGGEASGDSPSSTGAVWEAYPPLPRGWTGYPLTANGLYTFRCSGPANGTKGGGGGGTGAPGGELYSHPVTHQTYLALPQAFAEAYHVSFERVRELAKKLLAGEGTGADALKNVKPLTEGEEAQWQASPANRHILLDYALVQLLRVNYKRGVDRVQHRSGKPKRGRSPNGSAVDDNYRGENSYGGSRSHHRGGYYDRRHGRGSRR